MTRSKSKDHNNGRRLAQDCHENDNMKDEGEVDEHVQTVICVYFEKQCDPT